MVNRQTKLSVNNCGSAHTNTKLRSRLCPSWDVTPERRMDGYFERICNRKKARFLEKRGFIHSGRICGTPMEFLRVASWDSRERFGVLEHNITDGFYKFKILIILLKYFDFEMIIRTLQEYFERIFELLVPMGFSRDQIMKRYNHSFRVQLEFLRFQKIPKRFKSIPKHSTIHH